MIEKLLYAVGAIIGTVGLIETIMTPGLQLFTSFACGYLIGSSLARMMIE